MINEQNLKPFTKGYDPRRKGNGRKKGSKSLAAIIREFEGEDFDWKVLTKSSPAKTAKMIEERLKPMGAPFRALVYKAYLEAINGNVKAMDFLRKAGYGDKIDLTTDGEKIEMPIVISVIKPRKINAEDRPETEPSNRSDQ